MSAATPIISVNAGDTASAVLKLPFRVPPFGGVLGRSAAAAAATAAAAAASGVLATTVTGEPVSPPQCDAVIIDARVDSRGFPAHGDRFGARRAQRQAPRRSLPSRTRPDSETHLLDRLAVLYRYRRIALTVFVLATAAMMIQGYTNVQLYQARGQLIEDERSTAFRA